MKQPRLVILATTLVLLVIVALLLMQKPGERSASPGEGDHVVDIDSARVTEIRITSPGRHVTLNKEGGEWFLTDPVEYRADQTVVGSFIGQLESLRSKGVVSTNPEKQGMFEVDSTGTRVTVQAGDGEVTSLIVGKMGTSYSETYVRLDGSNEVHLVGEALTPITMRPTSDWRDKTILKVPRQEILAVHYEYGDTTLDLAFQDSVWTLGNVKADDQSVNALLGSLTDVRADGFVDTPPAPPLTPRAVVAYAGQVLRFYEGAAADSYLVQSSRSAQWFEMKSWRAGQILKRKSDLLAKSP